MNYKIGDKVIIDDEKIIKEIKEAIKEEKCKDDKKYLKEQLEKFEKYIEEQREEDKPFIIEKMMWESPETLVAYYLIGYWYIREDNIIGLTK